MWGFLLQVFMYAAIWYMMGRAAKNDLKAEAVQATTANEGTVIPVVHGTAWVGASVVWYGNSSSKSIKKKQGLQKVKVGYKYFSDLHVVLALGGVDSIRKIINDQKNVIYEGHFPSGTLTIDRKELYGETEGGVAGNITIGNNGFNTRLAAQGEFATRYLGVTSCVFHGGSFNSWVSSPEKGNYTGFYIGNMPSPKPMQFLVQNINKVLTSPLLEPFKSIPLGGITDNQSVYKRVLIVVDDNFLLSQSCIQAIKQSLEVLMGWYRSQVGLKAIFRLVGVRNTASGGDRVTAIAGGGLVALTEFDIEQFCQSLIGDRDTLPIIIGRSAPAMFFNADQEAFLNFTSASFAPAGAEISNEMYVYSRGHYGLNEERLISSNAKVLAKRILKKAKVTPMYFDYGTELFGGENLYRLLFSQKPVPIFPEEESQTALLDLVRATGDMSILGLNPAVIIYDCLINKQWGLGISEYDIDLVSFRKAAEQLYIEGFGLCFAWGKEGRIMDYIEEVRAHISAVLYEDAASGLWVLKLNRDDYIIDDLPVITKSEIISVDSIERTSFSDRVSQIIVKYKDIKLNKEATTTIQNAAIVAANNGRKNSKSVEYSGIVDSSLAARVALRDLRQASSSLASVQIKVPRHVVSGLNQGDCFVFRYEKYSEFDLVLRIIDLDFGDAKSSSVTLVCVEDIFSLPSSSTVTDENNFSDALKPRLDISAMRASELSYYQSAQLNDQPQKLVGVLVGRPDGAAVVDSVIYETSGGSSVNFEVVGSSEFAPFFTLESALSKKAKVITTNKFKDFDSSLEVPFLVSLNNECLRVNSYTLTASSLTLDVSRGADDTTPREHASSSNGFVVTDYVFSDLTPRSANSESYFAVTARDSSEETLLATAPEQLLKVTRRFEAPLPPINMKINGLEFPEDILGDVSLNFNIQGEKSSANILAWGDSAPIPAEGVTITARALLGTELLKQYTGFTGNTLNFSEIDLRDGRLTIELWSVKTGVDSWQKVSHSFNYTKVNMRLDIQVYSNRLIKGITNEFADVSVTIDNELLANYTAEVAGSNGITGKAPPLAEVTIIIDDGEE